MNIRKWMALSFAWLVLCRPALAEFEIVTLVNAVETSPSNIILPASMSGMISFRPCAGDCDLDYERVRLTAETRFLIDGESVKFEDFRKAFTVIKRNEDSYALLSYDTKTKTVMSIDVAR